MELSVVKHWTILGIKAIVIILAFMFILSKCSGCEHKVVKLSNNDSLNKVMAQNSIKLKAMEIKLIKVEGINDSLSKSKDKLKIVYVKSSTSVRADLKKGVCDTVKITKVLNDCDSTIATYDRIIAGKDTIISYQTAYIDVQKSSLKAKDDVITNKDADIRKLQKEVKKQRRKTILAIIGGAVTTALTIFVLH